jgi:hypothetical protein
MLTHVTGEQGPREAHADVLVVGAGAAGAAASAVAAAGSVARVYTRPSLDLTFVTVGLEYATRTPGWLRAILE